MPRFFEKLNHVTLPHRGITRPQTPVYGQPQSQGRGDSTSQSGFPLMNKIHLDASRFFKARSIPGSSSEEPQGRHEANVPRTQSVLETSSSLVAAICLLFSQGPRKLPRHYHHPPLCTMAQTNISPLFAGLIN